MKKLRFYMIVFAVLVSLPLAFVAWRTYAALDREAGAQMRFFAERLLDQIEAELGDLVRREENRPVDEYRHTLVYDGAPVPSPLAGVPAEGFIAGYFQNNPDGSFQTPLVEDPQVAPAEFDERVRRLQAVNAIFNRRKHGAQPPPPAPAEAQEVVQGAEKVQSSFADRFIRTPEHRKTKAILGQQQPRLEEITPGQALNLTRQESAPQKLQQEQSKNGGAQRYSAVSPARGPLTVAADAGRPPAESAAVPIDDRFQVEVAPLQAVAIDGEQVFVFRRVGIGGRIYRQGFVIRLEAFIDHLLATYYDPQPIARYTRLTLNAAGRTATRGRNPGGDVAPASIRLAERTFPAPFGFLGARMEAMSLPPSPARQALTLALALLCIVLAAGLAAIYRSARAVLDLSERRSRFVSAVTHELKTPLTNIRMYVEMLDQGIAATPQREQEYLGVLAAESARLSGLIDNVLELSRLEKRTRRFTLRQGDLSDVLNEVQSLMAAPLAREGFELKIEAGRVPLFAYDRDVLVQILINLMENSLKFSRQAPKKRVVIAARADGDRVTLSVCDSGPGIPKRALKRIFDDFYRVDGDLARTTGGTGLGLALVKKFAAAMGGRVWAANNDGPGCTIGLSLPINPNPTR